METKEDRSQCCREAQSDQAMRVTKDIAWSVGKHKFTPSPALAVEMSCLEHSKKQVCLLHPNRLPSCSSRISSCGQGKTIFLSFPIPPIPKGKSPDTFPTSPGLTHHVLHLGQASLPAVVYEPQNNDDGTDGADDHQYHKEFPIITACLVGVRLATCRG